jgi:hypothetical protein
MLKKVELDTERREQPLLAQVRNAILIDLTRRLSKRRRPGPGKQMNRVTRGRQGS